MLQISGVVYEDQSGNGNRDNAEPGIANIVVELLSGGGDQLDWVTTGSGGKYKFDGLAPGQYIIKILNPPLNLQLTEDPDGIKSPHQAAFTSTSTSADFGYAGN